MPAYRPKFHPLDSGPWDYLAVSPGELSFELRVGRLYVQFNIHSAQEIVGLLQGYLENERRLREEFERSYRVEIDDEPEG